MTILGELGLLLTGVGVLVLALSHWRSVTKRWAYREWRRDYELRLARVESIAKSRGRAARSGVLDTFVETNRAALARQDEIEVRLRALEGDEPGPPSLSFSSKKE